MKTTKVINCLVHDVSPATYARIQYSTTEGSEPLLVVSEGRSQPIMSSILCEARISKTKNKQLRSIKVPFLFQKNIFYLKYLKEVFSIICLMTN